MKNGYSSTKPHPVIRTAGQWQIRFNRRQVERQQEGATITEWQYDYVTVPEPPTGDTIVNTIRDAKIASGVSYVFPDATTGTIQTRTVRDLRNVQVTAAAAQAHIIAGYPSAPMVFRDAENVTHTLTAEEMLAMTMAVAEVGQTIYSASWAHKEALAGMSAEVVLSYDFDAGW